MMGCTHVLGAVTGGTSATVSDDVTISVMG